MDRDERYDRYVAEVEQWRMRAARSGGAFMRSGRTIIGIVAGLLVLLMLVSTLYQVQPEEVGVVLRLGRYVRTTEPGLRMKIPFVEEVRKVPVQRQLKEEFGFRTEEAGVRTTFSNANFGAEAVMLTGDLNVAVVEWIVQYRVFERVRADRGAAQATSRSHPKSG